MNIKIAEEKLEINEMYNFNWMEGKIKLEHSQKQKKNKECRKLGKFLTTYNIKINE